MTTGTAPDRSLVVWAFRRADARPGAKLVVRAHATAVGDIPIDDDGSLRISMPAGLRALGRAEEAQQGLTLTTNQLKQLAAIAASRL